MNDAMFSQAISVVKRPSITNVLRFILALSYLYTREKVQLLARGVEKVQLLARGVAVI